MFPWNNPCSTLYVDTLRSLKLLPLTGGDSGAQHLLRPHKSDHHTDRMCLELCETRFDPSALSGILHSVHQDKRRCCLARCWFMNMWTLWCSGVQIIWNSGPDLPRVHTFVADQADALTSAQSLITQRLASEDSSIWKCIKAKTQPGRLMN